GPSSPCPKATSSVSSVYDVGTALAHTAGVTRSSQGDLRIARLHGHAQAHWQALRREWPLSSPVCTNAGWSASAGNMHPRTYEFEHYHLGWVSRRGCRAGRWLAPVSLSGAVFWLVGCGTSC